MTKSKRWLSFLAGMFSGIMLILFVFAAIVYFGGHQIWLLRINTYEVADRLESAVKIMAEETLPTFIEATIDNVIKPIITTNELILEICKLKSK